MTDIYIYIYKTILTDSGPLVLYISTCCLKGRDKILCLQELVPFWTPPVKQSKIIKIGNAHRKKKSVNEKDYEQKLKSSCFDQKRNNYMSNVDLSNLYQVLLYPLTF